jgi:hypothetical protein
MRWFYKEFVTYAKQKNMTVLKDDYNFIEKCIRNMPQNEQRDVMRRYCTVWNAVVVGTENNVSKQNLGRFAANEFLRRYVE